jgi:hypothetical protein
MVFKNSTRNFEGTKILRNFFPNFERSMILRNISQILKSYGTSKYFTKFWMHYILQNIYPTFKSTSIIRNVDNYPKKSNIPEDSNPQQNICYKLNPLI